jgi:threonine/homoserine/homoserine lactone efflux protein
MSYQLLLAFVAACIVLALTPGPNMALIIANTASHGLQAGMTTLAGTSTGLIFLVTIAALGMTSVALFMAEWFDVLRWIGACYLAWLGFQQLRSWWRNRRVVDALPSVPAGSGRTWYLQGVGVSLSNPKVLFFLGAFLPQFVDPAGSVALQLTVLSILFVAILVAADVIFTLAVAGARQRFSTARLSVLDGISGILLLLGGAALAMARRP